MSSDEGSVSSSVGPLPPLPGTLVGRTIGDFLVERLIGRGGMGEVYLASQVSLKRNVALKILRANLAEDEQYLKRFRAEATAIAPISHPNIVSVYSIGESDGIHYIAFEYVRGLNLRQRIDREGALSESECVRVATQVARALECAAEAGIIHRDIKPENVLLTTKEEVKVADFGLAKQMGVEDVRLTRTGITMGTPLFMSPEQIQGQSLDSRCDIYALGLVCYNMLAGEPPYRGETAMSVAIQHVHGQAPLLSSIRPDVSPALLRVVAKMMAKRVDDRYASATDLLKDLESLRTVGATSLRSNTNWSGGLARGATNLLTYPTSQVTGWLDGPARPAIVVVTLLLAAITGLGMAVGYQQWKDRPLVSTSARVPDVSAVTLCEDGPLQLLHARSVLKGADKEVGYWAVLLNHRGDQESTIQAAQELAAIYLPSLEFDELECLAKYLIDRENSAQQAYGYLLRGIRQSRQGNPEASEQCLSEMMSRGRAANLNPENTEWLARQYAIVAQQNAESFGKAPESLRGDLAKFQEAFSLRRPPRNGTGGPNPRPPARSTDAVENDRRRP